MKSSKKMRSSVNSLGSWHFLYLKRIHLGLLICSDDYFVIINHRLENLWTHLKAQGKY